MTPDKVTEALATVRKTLQACTNNDSTWDALDVLEQAIADRGRPIVPGEMRGVPDALRIARNATIVAYGVPTPPEAVNAIRALETLADRAKVDRARQDAAEALARGADAGQVDVTPSAKVEPAEVEIDPDDQLVGLLNNAEAAYNTERGDLRANVAIAIRSANYIPALVEVGRSLAAENAELRRDLEAERKAHFVTANETLDANLVRLVTEHGKREAELRRRVEELESALRRGRDIVQGDDDEICALQAKLAAAEASLEEERSHGKYYVKARVYGAIAAKYREALESLADRGEVLASAALKWRYSEGCGVPMASVNEIGRLLDIAERASREKAKAVAEEREACALAITERAIWNAGPDIESVVSKVRRLIRARAAKSSP